MQQTSLAALLKHSRAMSAHRRLCRQESRGLPQPAVTLALPPEELPIPAPFSRATLYWTRREASGCALLVAAQAPGQRPALRSIAPLAIYSRWVRGRQVAPARPPMQGMSIRLPVL